MRGFKWGYLFFIFANSFILQYAWSQSSPPLTTLPATQTPDTARSVRTLLGITEYVLPNGLRIVFAPDMSQAATTVNLTYWVGSRHENTGESGYAHLLEHMLFKGTPSTPNVWAEFSKRGFRANGSTTHDRTNYYASFSESSESLNWFIGWLADAMTHSTILRSDLDSEMTVVRNEMERGENSPQRILLHKTLAVAYDWHAYGRSTIGARSDVEAADIEKLRSFYRTWYQPDNAVLIVSGKFDVTSTLARIQQTLGALPKPTRVLPVFPTLEVAQEGEKTVQFTRVGSTPLIGIALHAVPAAHADFVPLMLLTEIANKTDTGVLDQALVKTGLATSALAYIRAMKEPGYMWLGAELTPETTPSSARAAFGNALQKLASQPLLQSEFDLAKTALLRYYDSVLRTPDALAAALSEASAVGDWRLFFWQRDQIEKTQKKQVEQAAEKWLRADNRTVGWFTPLPENQASTLQKTRAPQPIFVNAQSVLENFAPTQTRETVAQFEATPSNLEAHTQRSTIKIGNQSDERNTLGLQLALLAKPTAGARITGVLRLHFGDEHSLRGKTELAEGVADMLLRGSQAWRGKPALQRSQIEDVLTELDANLSFSGDLNILNARFSMPKKHARAVLELLQQLLRAPAFDAAQAEEVRKQNLSQLESGKAQPATWAGNVLLRTTRSYARDDVRYTASIEESIAQQQAWRVSDLQQFHAQFLSANNAELSAVGDFDAAELTAWITELFSDWQSTRHFTRITYPHQTVAPTRIILAMPNKANAVLLAQRNFVMLDDDADYAALLVANHIIGGGGNSRLWLRLREREGLSYSVSSYVSVNVRDNNASWALSASFAPQNLSKVESALREEIARARISGINDEELKQAVEGMLAQRKLARTQDGIVASTLVSNLYWQRNFLRSAKLDTALQALTVAEVNHVLRTYFDERQWVSVIAGDVKQ